MRRRPQDRHSAILALLGERGRVGTSELADLLDISTPTARRDVEELEQQGRLVRRHGFIEAVGTSASRAEPVSRPVVALVVPRSDGYFVDFIAGAKEAARARHLRLVIAISGYSPSEETRIVAQLEGNAAGIVIIPTPVTTSALDNRSFLDGLASASIPLVVAEREPVLSSLASELPSVRSDHAIGVAAGIRRLVSLGYERVVLVVTTSPTSPALVQGFTGAASELGLGTGEYIEVSQPADLADEMPRIRELIAQEGTLAFIVHNDQTAVQLLTSLQVRGINAPVDYGIMAYEDSIGSMSDPALSAIAPPRRDVGFMAIDMLADRLEKRDSPDGNRHLSLVPRLVMRESTAAQGA